MTSRVRFFLGVSTIGRVEGKKSDLPGMVSTGLEVAGWHVRPDLAGSAVALVGCHAGAWRCRAGALEAVDALAHGHLFLALAHLARDFLGVSVAAEGGAW